MFAGVPGGIRTHGLSLRRRTLYPAELQRLILNWDWQRSLFPVRQLVEHNLRRRVPYPAELWRHMPQTLDFTGFLGFFPSAIYKIINSFSSCQSTDFFWFGNIRTFPNLENALLSPLAFFRIDSNWKLFFIFSLWGMPRLSLRKAPTNWLIQSSNIIIMEIWK